MSRSYRAGLLASVIAALCLSSCSPTLARTSPNQGVIGGGIYECGGGALQMKPTTPQYIAGIVELYPGTTPLYTFPSNAIIASQTIQAYQRFRFVVPPGTYLLVTRDMRGQRIPEGLVTVNRGETKARDVPGGCI
jgi:hypothetical protein